MERISNKATGVKTLENCAAVVKGMEELIAG